MIYFIIAIGFFSLGASLTSFWVLWLERKGKIIFVEKKTPNK